jgi:hypothetical protein
VQTRTADPSRLKVAGVSGSRFADSVNKTSAALGELQFMDQERVWNAQQRAARAPSGKSSGKYT